MNAQPHFGTERRRWLDFLSEEDLALVKRFVLASGSLKEMAAAYGVTYPTVRTRLNRLIEKIKAVDEVQPTCHFERVARAQYADGKIDLATLNTLLTAHQEELETSDENRADR